MAQVSGRAGRRKKQGTVVLQTSCPEHPLIQSVIHHDYEAMFRSQLEERQLFHYPPFFRILTLTVKHKHENVCKSLVESYASLLKKTLGNRVLGPDKPVIGRIQTLHIRKIVLKIEISASLQSIYQVLENAKSQMEQIPAFKYAIVQCDMDPL
jgi:primosomal protein N' (replication factor Y)